MATQSFSDLLVWQKASDFSISLYRAFLQTKDYGFRDQIQRAAISIPNNIAEGHARRSDRAFRNFLSIAKGSAAEVESMLIIATKLKYISETKQKELSLQVQEVAKLLAGFIKRL